MRGVARKAGRLRRILPVEQSLWVKFDLLRTLVRRDLEGRYKGSILGNLWPLLNQLSQLLIYTYVFSIVLKVKLTLKTLPENNFTFGLWLFAGLLPWIAFTSGLIQSANSVVTQSNLVKKVVFPLALLPLVPILSTFIESSFGLMALIFFVRHQCPYFTYYFGAVTLGLVNTIIAHSRIRLFDSRTHSVSARYSSDFRGNLKYLVLCNTACLSRIYYS